MSDQLAGFDVLLEQDGGRVDWGPGDTIAYSSIQHLSEQGLTSEIWTMDSRGKHRRCLTEGAEQIPHLSNDQPSWHPSGEYLLFQSANPNLPLPGIAEDQYEQFVQGGFGFNNDLWLMTADGRHYWKLFSVEAGEASLHAHFSPDGHKLLWSYARPPYRRGGEGWIMKVADFVDTGSGPHLINIEDWMPLGVSRGKDQVYEAHALSNSSNRILYSYSESLPLDFDIYTTNLVDGTSQNLTNAPGVWDEHAHWSPDMSTIAWVSSQGYPFTPSDSWQQDLQTDVWLMKRDGSDKERLTRFNEDGYVICADLAWSNDGLHLVLCRSEITLHQGSRQQILRLDLV